MKKTLTGTLTALLAAALALSAALADTLSLNGTVAAGDSIPVYAPIGGTVGEVKAEEGQQVKAEDVLYSMKTAKVYAEQDGTVTGIFGQPGDSAETVVNRYGAVMYLEGSVVYSVTASTDNAYNSTETKFVHAGETVYLVCRSSSARNGQGIITSVSGTSYTVDVLSGTFIPGDSVDVFRDAAHSAAKKIGRGTVSRVDPTAVTGSGSIVRIAVENGAQVKRGDLLLETLEGTFDGLYMSGTDIPAGQDGIVGSLAVSKGAAVQKDSVAAVIYPLDSMRAVAYVSEDSRSLIGEESPVTVELEADESRTYPGTVALVSSVAETGEGEATYRVVVDFVPDETVKIGMSVVVTTNEDEAPAEEAQEPAEEAAQETEAPAEEESGRHGRRRDGAEGFPQRPEDGMTGEGTEHEEGTQP